MPNNKRAAERVTLPGTIGEVTVYEPMLILDLSERGALIETRFPLHLDCLHEFRLSLDERSVVVKGRIVHSKIGEVGEGAVLYRTGVEFTEPSEHVLTAIRTFVQARRAAAQAPPPVIDAEIAEDSA
jgi:hypothetical protein